MVSTLRVLTAMLILFLTLSISLSQTVVIYSKTETISDARSEAYKAFKALVEAHAAGGDVNKLTDRLNEALNLISKAEETEKTNPKEAERLASEAKTLARSIIEEAPLVKEEGLKQRQMATIITATSIVGIVVTGVLICMFGPEAFWRMWLRLRKNYRVRVRHTPTRGKGSIITSEEVWAVMLAVILIGAVFAASQTFFAGRVVEPFSELGILGPNMKIGDYPREVVAGETAKLYIYVGNHMGKPVYYIVMIKLGDNKTRIDPAPLEPIMKLERTLLHSGTWISPINITLTEAGLNQRIVFELWTYNEASNKIEYHQRWGQIWINVTAPPI